MSLYESMLVGLDTADRVIAKAVRADELAVIGQREARLRRALLLRWRQHARRAAVAGGRAAGAGKGPEGVMGAVDRAMGPFPDAVAADVNRTIVDVYRLGGQRAAKQTVRRFTSGIVATSKSVDTDGNFDLIDTAAVRAIQRNVRFWIGEHYGRNISPVLRRVVADEILRQGGDRTQAAKAIEALLNTKLRSASVPSGWHGTDRAYFEGLAANIATTARTHATLNVMRDAQVLRYVIVNPMDERTCPVCNHMDGKVFSVSDGARMADEFVDAPTPDDARAAHPFVRRAALLAVSPKPGNVGARDASRLVKSRFHLPPFHFRCRCVLDIA